MYRLFGFVEDVLSSGLLWVGSGGVKVERRFEVDSFPRLALARENQPV